MPFTPAHVAAVLPLLHRQKHRFSATGLIIGSIAPDFEKFLRMGLHNSHSHTWPSLLYFSLPVGVGLTFLFHGVVRDPLLAHLPLTGRQRLSAGPRLAWPAWFSRHYPVVVGSLLLAAASHLLWDGCTHEGGFRGQYYPPLSIHLPALPGLPRRLSVYSLLDIISSVGGVVAVGWYGWQQPRRAVAAVPARALVRYWGRAGGGAAVLFGLRVALGPPLLNFWNLIISALAAGLAGVVVASVLTPGPGHPAAPPESARPR